MPGLQIAFLELRGAPFDMGLQYGRTCRAQIERALAVRLGIVCQRLPLTPTQCFQRAGRLAALLKDVCPSALEEAQGLARGARLSLHKICFMQCWEHIAGDPFSAGSCAGAGPEATESGGILIGLNRDAPPWTAEQIALVRREPKDGPASLQFGLYGEIGGPGLNAAGIACFDVALRGETCPDALPPRLACRVVLESADSAALPSLLARTPVSPCSIMVGDSRSERLLNLEIFGAHSEATYDGSGVYAHASVAHAPSLRQLDQPEDEAEPSRTREVQMLLLADRHRCGVNVAVMKALLSDHESFPCHSVCRHNGNGMPIQTSAALVADLNERRLHVCAGPPCVGRFEVFDL